ncbi:MAG: DegV family protein [Eubacteriales bacterium]|nr:DegV family protein [Eubacteriales bacterium]
MTKYVVDSSCEAVSYRGQRIESAPLMIYTDEVSYIDDGSMDIHNMLDTLEDYKGRSYTACPGTESWLKAFEGGDLIYVVAMTSGLSGTYNSAMVAKDIYLQEHPEARVEVFDTLSTGPESKLVVEKIIELDKSGCTFDEVCSKIREYMKHTRLFFALGSLHNMGQNGRVNKVLVSAIGLLGISIIATASEEGKVKPIAKARGERKVIKHILEEISGAGYKGGKLRISHVENEPLAIKVADGIRGNYADADIEIYPAGGLCSYYAERGGIIIGCETE